MKILSFIKHIFIIIILTLITQIGGIIWLLNMTIKPLLPEKRKRYFQLLTFLTLYVISTFILIPPIALLFGRTTLPITKSDNLAPHTYLTVLLNRHYVSPSLKKELISISDEFELLNPDIKTVYLDANFPFLDGFPLLPHLSHNDGKKVDLSFLYSNDGQISNQKPSKTGYGSYVEPLIDEINQPKNCLKKGYWQYDYPKYLSFGSNQVLTFAPSITKQLINLILKRERTQKVFIEPHLKSRMNINHTKLRYHGCKSVRHDDQIHYQIK